MADKTFNKLSHNLMQHLPFYELSNSEFNSLNGIWMRDLDLVTDLFDILPNPNKLDENDPDLMLSNITSNYYSVTKLNRLLENKRLKSLSLFHCNVRSLPKNLNLVNDLIYTLSNRPDILAVTETRLNNNTIVNTQIPGYNFYHQDSPTAAGGAGIYISQTLKSSIRTDIKFSTELVESCWIEIDSGNNAKNQIIVGCIYRHPKSKLDTFTEELEELLRKLNQGKYDIYLLGDFNINFLKYDSHQPTEKYLDMLYSNNITPVITKPTRLTDHTKTLIDHIYTNEPISNITTDIGLLDISDHLPVFCITNKCIQKNNAKIFYRDYKHFSKEAYINDMQNINWNSLLSTTGDLNQSTVNIINVIQDLVNKHVPLKQASLSKKKQLIKPWITDGILKSIKTKQKMYRTHFHSNNIEKVNQYKRYSNKLNKVKLESKNYYYNTQFAKCKNNMKATWKLIGSIIKRKTKGQIHPTKITINNKIYTAKQDIVNQLNQYFVNVGPNLANSITTSSFQPISYISNAAVPSFFMSPITATQVLNLFLGLDSNKVSIDIPNNMIKLAAYELSPIFTNIFNESISTGVVPDILKISRITPIYKSGDTNEPHNYRPISILSVFSKVLERLVYNQLDSFLEKYNIMYNYQFGFRKKHSTEQAILELTDKLKSAIDNRQLTCGLFLDFSKAFDTVNHKILLEKLQKYGIRGVPLQWFTSYLTNRQQYVRIDNTDSEMLRMTCGVPQGSTLGPLLFLLYINDMPNCSKKLSFRIFADDTNVFYSGKSVSEIEIVMNEEIKKIHNYCATNKLSINFKKTNFMIIGSKQKKIGKIQIGNIEQTQYIKYLGMYIDKHITWEQQIKHVKAKISKNTGIINKLRYYLDLNTLKQLYYTLIYPFINYGLMSWANTYKPLVESRCRHFSRLESCSSRVLPYTSMSSAIFLTPHSP